MCQREGVMCQRGEAKSTQAAKHTERAERAEPPQAHKNEAKDAP